jgi:trehalose 6-phosphate phosphatase
MTTTLPTLSARRSALFLDFDGTLAELASRPDAVQVAPDLPPLLDALHERLGGALAIVTGRARDDLQRWLPAQRWPGAFEHGAVRVAGNGQLCLAAVPDLSAVAAAAQGFVARHLGLVLERKQTSLSLHYRLNPALGPACTELLARAIEGQPGLQLMHGKAVVEVKSALVGKGRAIAAFMDEAPFAGRLPCFAGDDVTDEDGFDAVHTLGGETIKVGDGATRARHRCADPQALRAWLRQTLETSP